MYTLLSCQHCSHVVNYTGLISHLQLHELTESFLSILQLLKNTLVCGLLFFSRRNQTLFLFFRALMEAGTSSVPFIFLTKSTGLSVSLCLCHSHSWQLYCVSVIEEELGREWQQHLVSQMCSCFCKVPKYLWTPNVCVCSQETQSPACSDENHSLTLVHRGDCQVHGPSHY